MRLAAVVVLVFVTTASSATGYAGVRGEVSRPLASADSSPAGALTFTRANGSRIRFQDHVRAWCGAWNDPGSPRALHVAVLSRDGRGFARPYWHVSAIAAQVARHSVIRFPVGMTDSRPRGALIFATDALTGNESSTEEEEARGTISFAPVRCVPGGHVRFTVSAVLGSEFGDGKPIHVTGAYEGTIGRRPPGWPR